MIKLILGGARSGKSSYGENLYKDQEDLVYIATALVEDREMEARVEKHIERRPASWRTYEAYRDLDQALGEEDHYLLDCVTNMLSNIMYDITKDLDYIEKDIEKQIEDQTIEELDKLIEKVRKEGKSLSLISNEIGLGLVPSQHISRVFRDIQGRINQYLAQEADQVYFILAGIEVRIK